VKVIGRASDGRLIIEALEQELIDLDQATRIVRELVSTVDFAAVRISEQVGLDKAAVQVEQKAAAALGKESKPAAAVGKPPAGRVRKCVECGAEFSSIMPTTRTCPKKECKKAYVRRYQLEKRQQQQKAALAAAPGPAAALKAAPAAAPAAASVPKAAPAGALPTVGLAATQDRVARIRAVNQQLEDIGM
jgi:hypothetical protein